MEIDTEVSVTLKKKKNTEKRQILEFRVKRLFNLKWFCSI